jgi:hypothetical protein
MTQDTQQVKEEQQRKERIEKIRKQIKLQEREARDVHGSFHYAFIQMDQVRGAKSFILKGLANGILTTICVLGGLAIRDYFRAKNNGKLLTLVKGNNVPPKTGER